MTESDVIIIFHNFEEIFIYRVKKKRRYSITMKFQEFFVIIKRKYINLNIVLFT